MIRKYKLAGFLLMYHEVIKLGREVMIEQGLSDPSQCSGGESAGPGTRLFGLIAGGLSDRSFTHRSPQI